MFKSLRTRLFASYLVVLTIALFLVAIITISSLSDRETPPELTWLQLELLLSGFTSQQFVRDLLTAVSPDVEFTEVLNNFAINNSVRVMLVGVRDDDINVLFDSGNEYGGAYVPDFSITDTPPSLPNDGRQLSANLVFGGFTETNNAEWLFVGLERQIQRPRRAEFDSTVLLIADARSNASLAETLGEFQDILIQPLVRSACLGGIIAFILAIFLTRNIVRPLRALSSSAQQIAVGEFSEKVPETGPAEIRQVAEAFNRMTGEVTAAQQSQREFMANVSHDLKTPLTSIQGYSQAIIDGAAKNPAEAAKIINEEADRLNRMVQELTDLARLQAGRLSMKMTALDVGEIVAAIGQRLTMVASRKNITLTVRTGPMPTIAADGDRLVQVLTNLIGNAIKYTPQGGHINVRTGVKNGGVEIVIQDDGMGIPPEDLPRIFDRFYQVDKARGPQRGTGLGLAITQEIVLAHGGTIDISSEGANKGTTVTVWLPSPQLSTIVRRRPLAE